MDILISGKNIKKGFPMGDGSTFFANDGIDIEIEKGKLTILKGRSGSGKTTLINMLSGLDTPTSGEIYYEGQRFDTMKEDKKEDIRRYDMGFVFQSIALISAMNASENVDFALRLADYSGDREKRIQTLAKYIGLEKRMDHMVFQLSGGEAQRLAIARAVAHSPKVLFADEPTGALDTLTGFAVMKLFRKLCDEEGLSVVMTTHDPGLMELGDIVYEIEDGKITNVTRK